MTFLKYMLWSKKRLDFLVLMLWGSSKVVIYTIFTTMFCDTYWVCSQMFLIVAYGKNTCGTHRVKVSEQNLCLFAENLIYFLFLSLFFSSYLFLFLSIIISSLKVLYTLPYFLIISSLSFLPYTNIETS